MRYSVRVSRRLTSTLALIALASCAAFLSFTFKPAPALAQAAAPDNPGQWTAPQNWGSTAVHLALLRGDWGPHRTAHNVHSELLWWGFAAPGDPAWGGLKAWNPATDDCAASLTQNLMALPVPLPPCNIFCAGHAGLPSGDLLIIGGHENGITGLTNGTIFWRESRGWGGRMAR